MTIHDSFTLLERDKNTRIVTDLKLQDVTKNWTIPLVVCSFQTLKDHLPFQFDIYFWSFAAICTQSSNYLLSRSLLFSYVGSGTL